MSVLCGNVPITSKRKVIMSNFTENVVISKYDSKTSKAEVGEMLLVSRGSEKKGTVAICASVPRLTMADVESNWNVLGHHVLSWLESKRSGILRSYEERGHCLKDEIGIAGIIVALELESKLEKEEVKAWIEEDNNTQAIRAAIALKMSFDSENLTATQEARLTHGYNALKDLMIDAASSRKGLGEKKNNIIKSYLEVLEDSIVGAKMAAKLASWKQQDNDILDSL